MNRFIPSFLLALLFLSGCHFYDSSQKPDIALSLEGPVPVINWTPGDAYRIQFYKGPIQEDDLKREVVWDFTGFEYANQIQSPVTYGDAPSNAIMRKEAETLVSGQEYTVLVERVDPKASGDGFTRRAHDYHDSVTFTAK